MLSGAIAIWYTAVFLMAISGLIRHSHRVRPWAAGLLLVVSLTGLHSVYWSNMRMRSPLVPVVSLLASSVMFSREKLFPDEF